MFSELSGCSTWECINSFASWVSALGTILISGLALWLSWKDRLIRIQAIFDYGLIPGDNPSVLNREVYILSFTNIGHRTAIVTNYEWKIRSLPRIWKFYRCITFPHLEPSLQYLTTKFPLELTTGKEGHIFHKSTFLEELEEREKHLYTSSNWLAFYRIFTFKLVLKTTVGKTIYAKIPFRVRKQIWKKYKKIT